MRMNWDKCAEELQTFSNHFKFSYFPAQFSSYLEEDGIVDKSGRHDICQKKNDTLKNALVVIPVKGRVRVPKRMNFRKGSKRQLTPNPHPSE